MKVSYILVDLHLWKTHLQSWTWMYYFRGPSSKFLLLFFHIFKVCYRLFFNALYTLGWRASGGVSGKESVCQCRIHGISSWVGKIPWRRKWQPTPVVLPGWNPMDREEPGGLQSMGLQSQKWLGIYTHTIVCDLSIFSCAWWPSVFSLEKCLLMCSVFFDWVYFVELYVLFVYFRN